MNVLVTGASGFVGRCLCAALVDSGLKVTAIVRSQCEQLKNIKLFIKDLNSERDFQDALSDVDVVIHLAGRAHVMKESLTDSYQAYADINLHATKHLAEQAALAGVKRFVYLSSIKVNGESTGDSAFNELSKPQPKDDYGKTKHQAEEALKDLCEKNKMELVIIRPPLVYGPDVKANFLNLIKLCDKNIPLPFGAINNQRSFIYLENLISFIMVCITHPSAANNTFLVSDNSDQSTTNLIRMIRSKLNKPSLLLPIPNSVIKLLLKILGKKSLAERLCQNLQVDIKKAQKILDWKPLYSFEDGIANTVKSYKNKYD